MFNLGNMPWRRLPWSRGVMLGLLNLLLNVISTLANSSNQLNKASSVFQVPPSAILSEDHNHYNSENNNHHRTGLDLAEQQGLRHHVIVLPQDGEGGGGGEVAAGASQHKIQELFLHDLRHRKHASRGEQLLHKITADMASSSSSSFPTLHKSSLHNSDEDDPDGPSAEGLSKLSGTQSKIESPSSSASITIQHHSKPRNQFHHEHVSHNVDEENNYFTRKGQKTDKAIASVLGARLRFRGNSSQTLDLQQGKRKRRGRLRSNRSPPQRNRGETQPDLNTHNQLTSRSDRPQTNGKNTSWQYHYVPLDDLPDPRMDWVKCGRHHASFVCDPYRNLTIKEGIALDKGIQHMCRSTPCQCEDKCSKMCPGYKIAIVIIPNSDSLIRDGGIAEWSDRLRTKTWNIGGTCQDDVLLVVSVEERNLYMSVGEKARKKLKGVCSNAVQKDAGRTLKHGRVTDTLLQLLKDIKLVFEDDFKCELSFIDVMPTGKVIGIIFASVGPVILVVVILVFLGPCFRGRGFGGSSGSKHRSYYRRGYASSQVDMPWRNSSRNEDVQPANSMAGF